jgi:hypothetical protein
MQWDGRRTGFFEAWYLTLTDLETRTGFWIRYTVDVPARLGRPSCGVWFISFPREGDPGEVARTVELPVSELRTYDEPFQLFVGDAVLRDGEARGEIPGAARWALSWQPPPAALRLLPPLAYQLPVARSRAVTAAPAAAVNGLIEAGGQTYRLSRASGGQGHIWGTKHSDAWAWARCSAWDDGADAAFEAVSAPALSLGGRRIDSTLVALRLEGREHVLNGFLDSLLARSRSETGRWSFAAADAELRIEGEVTRAPERLVVAALPEPDGDTSYCHASEVATLQLRTWRRRRPFSTWRPGPELSATGLAHAEWASRQPDERVTRRIRMVGYPSRRAA